MNMQLDAAQFAEFFGVDESAMPAAVTQAIDRSDFRYRQLTQKERDATILRVIQRIESGELSVVGEHRKDIWEKGWEENLEDFSAQGFALETLMPRFMRAEPVVRLNQDYVCALHPRFEFQFHDVMRRWLYSAFMQGCEAVFEFGCGSSYNLVAINELAPGLRLVGLDWAESAVKLANRIGKNHSINLIGRRFDFFHPASDIDLGGKDAVLTVCALEQVGERFEAFLQFLLAKRPKICVHMEPLADLYEADHLVDQLALRFHTRRNYLHGFLPRLQALQAEKKIEILAQRRVKFGSLFHEGYSYVVWRAC